LNIFLTGGTGCPGRSLVRALLEAGHRVAVLAPEDGVFPEHSRLQVFEGEVGSRDDLGMALRASGADTVLHLAALDEPTPPDPEALTRVNLDSVEVLVQLASMGLVERLLYTSTVLALGPTDGTVGDEQRTPEALAGSRWLETRAHALYRVREAASMGCPVITLLAGVVYGPQLEGEPPALSRLVAALQAGRGRVSADPGCRLCLACEEDLVRGHLLALERGRPGSDYILGGPNLSLREFCETAARLAGRKPARTDGRYLSALLATAASSALARLAGRSPSRPPELLRLLHLDWAYSSRRAEQELGYTVTAVEDALS
jgi:nucleoside-diphosphate-sugar epimerase